MQINLGTMDYLSVIKFECIAIIIKYATHDHGFQNGNR